MQENTTPAEQDIVEPVESIIHSTNQTRILDLEAQLAKAQADRDYFSKLATQRASTIWQAREAIEEVLAGDVNPQSTFDDFQTAFELLGVTLTREVEIEVTVTWRGTITLPAGVDVDDLDIDDFDITGFPTHNDCDTEFPNGMHDYRISER